MADISMLALFTDPYERKARLIPALMVLLPVIVLLATRVGSTNALMATLATLGVTCGATVLFAQVARGLGKMAERRLIRKWGGWPTTIMLRHADGALDRVTKARYHARLTAAGLALPTPQDEKSDPDQADHAYRAATKWLIARSTDRHAFPNVFRENVAYGFARNMHGSRWLGALVAGGVALLTLGRHGVVAVSAPYLRSFPADLPVADGTVLVVSLLMLVLWVAYFRASTVRLFADSYAEQLLTTVEKT